MTEQGSIVNGTHSNLSTVSRSLGNGVKDAIKRLSQAQSRCSSQSNDSPEHVISPTSPMSPTLPTSPMYTMRQIGPQISIEQVDSDDGTDPQGFIACIRQHPPSTVPQYSSSVVLKNGGPLKHSDQLCIDQSKAKSNSLPIGLTLQDGIRTSSISSSTCTYDTHEDSDLSDELRPLAELDSSLDIDKEMAVVVKSSSKQRKSGASKKKLAHTLSVNSDFSALGSSSEMSSDDEHCLKSYSTPETVLETLDPDDEVFHDAEIDKCSDADMKLIDWACNVFSPACQTLLQHCAEGHEGKSGQIQRRADSLEDKSGQIQYGLRNLSNTINYFCTEQQRLSGQIKAFMLRGISSSISTDHFLKLGVDKSSTLNVHHTSSVKTSASSDSTSTSERESGESQYDHRSYAVKVLRSVSQSLIVPLLRDAQNGFTDELYRAIVQALQKISWKVEACLSFNDPTNLFQIHSLIFSKEPTTNIKDMMIGVLPPEEPNLQTAARSRSSSLSGSKSKDSGSKSKESSPRKVHSNLEHSEQKVIKRTPSGRLRPTGNVFDSESLPEDFEVDLKQPSGSIGIPGTREENTMSGDATPLAKSLDTTPKLLRTRTATDGDLSQSWKSRPVSRYDSTTPVDERGVEIEITPDYFRPNRARRTTVSLSRREVTKLGLTVAKRIDETIDVESSFRLSAEGQSPNEEEEGVREQIHTALIKKFDKIREDKEKSPVSHYSRIKSASMSDLLDDDSTFLSPPPTNQNGRRHDSYNESTRKASLEVNGDNSVLPSPGPYSPTYTKSYMSLNRQRSEGTLLDNADDWVYLEGEHIVDPRVARGNSLLTPSPTNTPTRKGKKKLKTNKNTEKKKLVDKSFSASGKFTKSLMKTAQALRRASTSISKSSKTNLTTTVEVGSLDILLESPAKPLTRPKSSMSEPPSPLSKSRDAKSETMPKKRIGTLFRGNKPASKSFSKGDSLSRKKRQQRSGFLEGYQDVSLVNALADSIDLQYSGVAEVEKGIQAEGDEQLLISVEVAEKQTLKATKKRLSMGSTGSGSSWFEVTVTTNIKQFGRSHYTILRTFKQVLSLFDDLAASHAVYKLPERPDKKTHFRKQCQQMEDFFRYVSGNSELRGCKAFVMFLMPDDEFGSFTDNGSEVSFDLLMTFYTPDIYPGPPGSHRDVETVLPENTPSKHTPSPSRTRKQGTLKKGTLHVLKKEGREESSTFVIREEEQDALIIACDDERYVVVAGTFDKLVEQLACEEKPDPRFVTTLLLGYRHFSSSVELLTGLLRRFHLELPPDATDEEIVYAEKWRYVIQLRVLDILTYWMKKCWPDFYRHQEVMDMTNDFIEDLKSSKDPNFKLAGKNLDIFINEKKETSPNVYSLTTPTTSRPPSTPSTPSTPIRSHPVATLERCINEHGSPLSQRAGRSPGRSPTHHQPVDINTLTAIQLARQLTLIELEFLKLITTHELAVYTWECNDSANKPYRKNLDNFIARFNKVSYWVASEICSGEDEKTRGALIEKFVEIAKQCHEHKNFNTTTSIVSGLSLAAVRRLKRSWEHVGEKTNKAFHKLHLVTLPSNNHVNYRKILSTVHRRDACIPYFGVFIRDLIFFNDGNNKKLKNGLINFSKLRTMVLKFEELKRYQRSKYFFPPEDRTREFCRNLWSLSETDLYELSLSVEPRDRPQTASPETDV